MSMTIGDTPDSFYRDEGNGAHCAARNRYGSGVRIGCFGLVLPLPFQQSEGSAYIYVDNFPTFPPVNHTIAQRRICQLTMQVSKDIRGIT